MYQAHLGFRCLQLQVGSPTTAGTPAPATAAPHHDRAPIASLYRRRSMCVRYLRNHDCVRADLRAPRVPGGSILRRCHPTGAGSQFDSIAHNHALCVLHPESCLAYQQLHSDVCPRSGCPRSTCWTSSSSCPTHLTLEGLHTHTRTNRCTLPSPHSSS